MILGSFEERLCLCDWRYRKRRESVDRRIREGLNAEFLEKETSITEKTHQQIREYLDGDRKIFEIPLLMVGTDFQKNVWEELLKIPFGGRETYAGLSRKLTNEKAIRAVAAANGANAIALLIPCHRIVGSGENCLATQEVYRLRRNCFSWRLMKIVPDKWNCSTKKNRPASGRTVFAIHRFWFVKFVKRYEALKPDLF